MAFYLNTQHGLTEYQLGDFISNPVRAFFLVSDEELIEQDYEITYADGETSIVVMKNILVKNNQYYYSLPWKFIQSIDVYQITNPDFVDSACCSNFNMTLDVLYGQSETVNQVSATGGPDGTLCWNGFGFFGAPKTYIISFGEEYLNGGLTLNISAIVDSPAFRYTTETGDCYEGILESPHPYVNVFQIVNNNDDVSDDNEEPNFTDADEPIFSDDPTPTPTQTPEEVYCTEDAFECWDGSFVSRDPTNNCEFYPCPQTPTPTPTPTPWTGEVYFYAMKQISDCSAGRFEMHISRDNGLNYTQLGVAMNFTTNTSMTNGLNVPQLLRSPGTLNTAVSVGDKIKIVYRTLQIDGYSTNDSLRTSCGLDYEHSLISIETGNTLSIDSTITGWYSESEIVSPTNTTTNLEYIHTVSENDNLNFCGIVSVEEKIWPTPTPTPTPTQTSTPTPTQTPISKVNVYWMKTHECALGNFELRINGSIAQTGSNFADHPTSGSDPLVNNPTLIRSVEIFTDDLIMIRGRSIAVANPEGCPDYSDRYVQIESGDFDANGDWVTDQVVVQPMRGEYYWSPYQFTFAGGGDVNFLCKMVFVQSSSNIQLDGLVTYTSEPNGYFKYTVENKSSNSDFNDSKYFYEVKRAFDQWDSVITESPYTIIENQESVSWNLEVAVEFDSLESGTLGGAMLSEVLTINENYEFKFGETFPTKGDFILSTLYLDYLYSETDITGNTQLFSVTLHEVGHLLGIGYITFYHSGIITDQPIVSYTDTTENVTKRYYTGTNGLTAYNEYFSNGNNNLVGIPIEDDGGAGTAHVHAEEGHVDYGYGDISSNDRYINNVWHPGLENELMTGWSEDDASMPMSKITLGLLEDIGFSINYNKVETYNTTPTSLSS